MELKLELHPNRQKILPLSNGIDFLGYVVRPSHLLLRRRVVAKFRQTVAEFTSGMAHREGKMVNWVFPPEKINRLHSVVQSYLGLFRHGSCYRLAAAIFYKFGVLRLLFERRDLRVKRRWILPFRPKNLYTQFAFFRSRFRGRILFQVGCYLEFFNRDAIWASKTLGMARIPPRKGFYARCGIHQSRLEMLNRKLSGTELLFVFQTGKTAGNIAQRSPTRIDVLAGNWRGSC
jgi:hypothetical protein